MSENDDIGIDIEINKQKEKLKSTIAGTLHYKIAMDNNTYLQKQQTSCCLNCYEDFSNESSKLGPQDFSANYTKLQDCHQFCLNPLQDAVIYNRNIDFLSQRKFDGCSSSCYGKYQASLQNLDKSSNDSGVDGNKAQIAYYECLNDCYMRLLKRYRGYWLNHKNKLINRYFSNSDS